MTHSKPSILLVANWESGVGYAWWLMESYWSIIAQNYQDQFQIHLAYPKITTIPKEIRDAPIQIHVQNLVSTNVLDVLRQCQFISRHQIKCMYLSDHPSWHWRYALFRLCGVTHIITHDHTPGLRTPPKGIKRSLKRLINRQRWISAEISIGATDFIRKRLIDVACVPKERAFTVANGLPDPATGPSVFDPYTTFSIPTERRIMVMTGRANRYKNIDFAIDALHSLVKNRNRRDIHFLFIGDGPHTKSFRQRAQTLGIANYVTFAGHRTDVDSILPTCYLAIHPSLGEVGYSLSILEYMRSALPVVVPNNPSVCGATSHGVTGLIYREHDMDDCANAIETLLEDDSLRQELGLAAKEIQQRHFTLEIAHSQLLDILEQLLTPKPVIHDSRGDR